MRKQYVCKKEGVNIYKSYDCYGRMHLHAYKDRKQIAEEMFYINGHEEMNMAINFMLDRIKHPPFMVTIKFM